MFLTIVFIRAWPCGDLVSIHFFHMAYSSNGFILYVEEMKT